MNARLSAEQVADLRRSPERSAKDAARDLGISKPEAEAILADLDAQTPLWAGREPSRLVLGVGIVLLALLTAWTYSNNTEGSFLFDDVAAVQTEEVDTLRSWMQNNVREDDPPFHKLSNVRDGLSRTLDQLFAFNRFRVVTYATFAWQEWWNAGPDVEGHRDANGGLISDNPAKPEPSVHSFNNWIHVLNGALATCLAFLTFTAPAFRRSQRALRYPAAGALLVGAIFSLHPLQTQAVTYIAQRAESLGAFFFLASLCALIWARRRSEGETRGERPYLSVLLWATLLGLCGLLIVLSAKTSLAFSTAVKVAFAGFVAAVVGSVVLVKKGLDEPLHVAAVGVGFSAFILGLETKEVVAVMPGVLLAWELLFGREPAAAPSSAGVEATETAAGESSEEDPTEAEAASLLPAGPPALQKAWGWRALRAFATKPRLRYHSPWVAGVLLVLLAFPVIGGPNFAAQFLSSRGVELGGRQDVRLTPANYLLTQANVFHSYVRLSVLPVDQTVDHDYPLALTPPVGEGPQGPLVERIGDYAKPLAPPPLSSGFTTLLSLALILAAIALALLYGGRARIPSFALILALLVLAPSSSLVVLADVIFEHRFYLPLFGLSLLLPPLVERAVTALAPQAPRLYVFGGLIVVLAGVGVALTRARNEVWHDDRGLWGEVTQRSPRKPRGWVNLGLFWQKLETHVVFHRTPQGVVKIPCAPRLLPGGQDVLILQLSHQVARPRVIPLGEIASIAEIEETKEAPRTAERCYDSALEIEPYGKALNNKAIISVYRFQHLTQEAEVIRKLLIPRYQQQGDQPRLQACLARLEEIAPLREAAGDAAERALLAKVAMDQADFFTLNNLGGLYSIRNQFGLAINYLQQAVLVTGYEELTWAGLGEAHQKRGVTRWLFGHSLTDEAHRQRYFTTAEESWRAAAEAYRTFLQKKPNAPQAGYVRKSLAQVEGWLRGENRPDPKTQKIPPGALVD